MPRWGLLELIVESLGGDTETFHRLWLAASAAHEAPASGNSPAAAADPAPAGWDDVVDGPVG